MLFCSNFIIDYTQRVGLDDIVILDCQQTTWRVNWTYSYHSCVHGVVSNYHRINIPKHRHSCAAKLLQFGQRRIRSFERRRAAIAGMKTCLWSANHHLDSTALPRHGCHSDRGPAAGGGWTVLGDDRNGGRYRPYRLIASRQDDDEMMYRYVDT